MNVRNVIALMILGSLFLTIMSPPALAGKLTIKHARAGLTLPDIKLERIARTLDQCWEIGS